MTMLIEKLLEEALNRLLTETPKHLRDSIHYSLMGPGKRIRPRLTFASAELFKIPEAAAASAAVAIEMVHCYTLIHDDLPCMDNDDMRRGRPSNHKKFDEATALLAGDGLMALAVEALLEAAPHVAPANLIRAVKRLTWAMGPRGVIAGQAAESQLSEKSTLDDLRKMHQGKTGALFTAALLMPADLAGIHASSPEGQALDRFAADLGSAFQVADDLEDAEQDRENRSIATILRYLSPAQAKLQTRQALEKNQAALLAIWGAHSKQLCEITDEVIRKLEKS